MKNWLSYFVNFALMNYSMDYDTFYRFNFTFKDISLFPFRSFDTNQLDTMGNDGTNTQLQYLLNIDHMRRRKLLGMGLHSSM